MRIRRLTVQGFRGISQSVTLHFSNADSGSVASCLLIGENGAGKSSFVDALEFCLSGKFPTNPNMSKWPYLQRLANVSDFARESRVEVEFTDGSTYSRSVVEVEGTWAMSPRSPHNLFQGAGFTLRREEIISFLRTPPDKRYGVFASFMRSAIAAAEVPQEATDAVAKAEAVREARRKSRDNAARTLARKMKLNYRRVEPALQGIPTFNGWFASQGYVKKQDERGGRKLSREREAVYRQAALVRREVEQFIAATEQMNRQKQVASKAPLIALLAEVGGSLTESFKRISPSAQTVASVELMLSPDKAEIDLDVLLMNGLRLRAEHYFSEANLDLLALLLFLSLMKFAAKNGQPKIMALDDVLQSVDASIRVKVAQYLLSEFGNWQLLVTFHDRLWREQFGAVFATKHQFLERELVDWGLESGPKLIEAKRDPSSALRDSLISNDSRLICGNAGFLLEVMSDWMSKSLQTSVTRRYGDKYTLGDTWPGVLKRLRKTSMCQAGLLVDSYMWLRNIHGAHYNEWATDLSMTDAHAFAVSVLSLWDGIWCPLCREPVGKHGDLLHCRCGTCSISVQ
ncbi:AAA family ATPase [Streptomyces luteogriseus]|uniref:AAA family ATPase n=1 Tax=Streptomyces luteogriseus TaxID=68233 RepID=UPI00378F8300